RYTGPQPLPDKIKKEFAYPSFQGEYVEILKSTNDAYWIKEVEFISQYNLIEPEHTIKITYYHPRRRSKPLPVVMVLPILGGKNQAAKFFARYFARQGFAAIIVHRQEKYKKIQEIDKINEVLRQMVFDHRQVIDWIEQRDELDSDHIAVFGISMGGIKATILSAIDQRIKVSVLALVGGDIPYLLTFSTEKGIIKRRNIFLKDKQMTLAEFYQYLRQKVNCDPINYAQFIDARKVLMVLAIFDQVVPFKKGEELRKKMGKPDTVYIAAGHYSSIIYIFYIRSVALNFIKEKFGFLTNNHSRHQEDEDLWEIR
ncbi:alpha/beta hydrolase, partial [Candidatus Parcubacteria bacterium]